MKKEYLKPNMKVVDIKTTRLLTGSGKGVYGKVNNITTGQEELILQYGGIDEEGEMDPE